MMMIAINKSSATGKEMGYISQMPNNRTVFRS